MWIVLIGFGVIIYLTVAVRQSDMVKMLTVLITIWEAFIYLYTALRNPGIASSEEPEETDSEKYERNPK